MEQYTHDGLSFSISARVFDKPELQTIMGYQFHMVVRKETVMLEHSLEAGRVTDGAGGAGMARAEHPLHRWYLLGILLLIYIFGAVDRSVVSVIAEPLKHDFHLNDAQLGALGGMAYSITFAAFVLPMGWLIDRVDRRVLLAASTAIWSLLTMCGAIAGNFAHLVLARMGVGAAESGASPASVSLISDSFPLHQRNTAISIYYSGAPAGQLVIFVLGGWILMHFEWQAVFLVAGVPGLVLAALLFFTCREPVRGSQDLRAGPSAKSADAKAPPMREVLRTIVRDPALRFAMLGNMIVTGVNSTLVLWLTSFLVRIHGLPVSRAAIWVGLGYGLSQTLAALAVGPFADRYSRSLSSRLARIPATATLLALAAGTVMALTGSLTVALGALILFSFIGGFFNGPSYALVLSLAQPRMRGSVMAASKLLVILIGSGLFPFLTGAISDAVGTENSIQPAILATMSLLAVASCCFVLAGRRARATE